MNLSNCKIVKQNGEVVDLFKDAGIIVSNFDPYSPKPNTFREYINQRDGFEDYGTVYDGRRLEIRGGYIAKDSYDYRLVRNEIFRLFDSREYFYIINDAEPSKRWYVKYDSPYSFKRTGNVGQFNIELFSNSPYAESVGTTLDGINFDSELWQIGQGLPLDETPVYEHDTTTFRIFNAGDKDIDPRELPLKITFAGGANNLKIINHTTDETWNYYVPTNDWDQITLDGIKATLNGGISIFSDTNRELITIKQGWNDFEVTGVNSGTSFLISFDFRFYYL